MTTLSEKHRPKKYSEFIGQEKAISEIQTFLKEFPKRKAILLYGPPGTGKTSLALVAAKENNFEVFELNSSDLRNRAKLEEILKPASLQTSLFKKGKILLVDEVDGITGTDIGGVPELIRIIDSAEHPIIITGNDIWQSKLGQLRPKCKLVEMKSLQVESILELFKKVAEHEKIPINPVLWKQLAIKSQGDLRAALNDFQSYALELNSQDSGDGEKRNKEETIFNILRLLFHERQDFLQLFDNTDMSLDEIFLWIEENIPREYAGNELARAYEALSKADCFRGRIYRQQFWRFLIYQNIFQSAGIAYSKRYSRNKFTNTKPQKEY